RRRVRSEGGQPRPLPVRQPGLRGRGRGTGRTAQRRQRRRDDDALTPPQKQDVDDAGVLLDVVLDLQLPPDESGGSRSEDAGAVRVAPRRDGGGTRPPRRDLGHLSPQRGTPGPRVCAAPPATPGPEPYRD